jgi:CcmD family protein
MDSRNFTYLFYGFLAAWMIIFVYILTIVAREGRLKKELDRVRRMIEEKELSSNK